MDSGPGPAARALLALEVVQANPGITADRLAERLGVSERAARRSVGVLRDAGIPIESVRGPYGGYRVGRGLRLPPLTFTSAEALSLVMAVLDGHHDASDPATPVGAALGKIVRALPAQVAAQADAVRKTTAPAPDRAAARPDPQTTATLVQACADVVRVRIWYRTESGSERDFVIDPWAVVVRHGRWYLVCWSHAAADRRAYRLDRVQRVEVSAEGFTPPAPFDAVAVLEEHLAVGWEYSVSLILAAPLATVAGRVPPALGKLEAADADTCRLTGTTGNPWWYAEQLAALPVPFRILGGPELRHTARVVGSRLVAAASD
ncbi:helix-turn-helix transcriptional regulator [Dactylosporangium siamense]|uniref:Transcriptional regulator n=1 Tax=Dactylosporangium siamense TaxID=685454 RepID=A0A919PJE0_9ACTN|nr:WYL domain-containing protein [Dactylosporangium siamense]GIG45232.1 transcriptional regulator [Dactylosporangium siamense]